MDEVIVIEKYSIQADKYYYRLQKVAHYTDNII